MELHPSSDHISNVLEDALNERNLIFTAASLTNMGFESMDEIAQAVERAITICNCNGLSVTEHFKTVYISDHDSHTVRRDWKLSKLGYTLVMMNGSCENPVVGRLQIEMLKKYMAHSRDES
jgi:hypothetical protein